MSYSVVDTQRKIIKIYEKFRKEHKKYSKEIKRLAENFFSKNLKEVLIFGSFAEGRHKPYSDIDVAIILKSACDEAKRAKFVNLIYKKFGINPFEIHIVDEETWNKFYSRFVKKFWRV